MTFPQFAGLSLRMRDETLLRIPFSPPPPATPPPTPAPDLSAFSKAMGVGGGLLVLTFFNSTF